MFKDFIQRYTHHTQTHSHTHIPYRELTVCVTATLMTNLLAYMYVCTIYFNIITHIFDTIMLKNSVFFCRNKNTK